MQDERSIIRTIPKLREELGNFTSKRVQLESGVSHVSNRTIRNVLNRERYHYLRSRKNGLLHATDLKCRKKFCQKVRRKKLSQKFWNEGISMYLDGKGFEYNSKGKLFLMDGCPRQNSRVAMCALEKVVAKVFRIPGSEVQISTQ